MVAIADRESSTRAAPALTAGSCGGGVPVTSAGVPAGTNVPAARILAARPGLARRTSFARLAIPETIMPIEIHSYLTFLLASLLLILVPGPSQALVLARTLSGGKRAGALTAVGLNVGTLFHAAAAAFGLSAVLATSAVAFSVVKFVGAAYLVYLGIQALRTPATPSA